MGEVPTPTKKISRKTKAERLISNEQMRIALIPLKLPQAFSNFPFRTQNTCAQTSVESKLNHHDRPASPKPNKKE
jgi:hypothetical protein